jgi:hypothetical protein
MRGLRLTLLLVASLSLSACRCGGAARATDLAPVNVTPSALTFDPTFIGTTRSLPLEVSNPNRVQVQLSAAIEGPFELSEAPTLAGGAGATLTVRFRPTSPGVATGVLRLDKTTVELAGEGRAAPSCQVDDPCAEGRLDAEAMQCVVVPRAEGSVCADSCVASGACLAGRCVGAATRCDDGDPCTDDACSERGCVATLTRCPAPSAPCRVPVCAPRTGCGSVEAPDGTLCGPDDCLATTVDVCLAGRCVTRQRPATARCTNTWLPIALGAVGWHQLAFDEARGKTLLSFAPNGIGQQTWRWDGSLWEFLLPNQELPDRTDFALAWNPLRQRVLAFGGLGLNETWEWDGATWAQLHPAVEPECGHQPSLAFDPVSRTLLLVCSFFTGSFEPQAWSFDGLTWRRLAAPAAPLRLLVDGPGRTVLGLDRAGRTHRWDGARFVDVAATPPTDADFVLGVDPRSRGAVLFGVSSNAGQLWRWTRGAWQLDPEAPPVLAGATATLDTSRNRLVVVTHASVAAQTWEWDGTTWTLAWSAPPFLGFPSLATGDGGVWLTGQSGARNVVFSLANRRWSQAEDAPPPGHTTHLAYEPSTQRLLAVQERPGALTVGAFMLTSSGWTPTGAAPTARSWTSVAFNPGLNRVLLFGGTVADARLWTFDGTSWTALGADGGPGERWGACLLSDHTGAALVLGGFELSASQAPPQVDAFQWADGGWSALPPIPATGGAWARGAADPTRQVLLVVTQSPIELVPLTWEWNGVAWSQRQPLRPLPRLIQYTMAYDPSLRRVLLHDGFTTWAFLP